MKNDIETIRSRPAMFVGDTTRGGMAVHEMLWDLTTDVLDGDDD